MNPRHRHTKQLTLGFLTLGAQAAPLEVIGAAVDTGFRAVGLRISGRLPGDAWPAVDMDPAAFRKIRAAAAEHAVRISSVAGYYITPQTRIGHLLANVHAARELGAPLIAQGCFDADHAQVATLLRDYAQAANEAGVRIALEFMPMSELKNIAQTLAVIERSGASNVGLLIDSLHLARSGDGAAEVLALDPRSIYLTQLCDAPANLAPGNSLFEEAMSGRLYLGHGGLDLAALVNALPAGAEIELETPVTAHAALEPAQRARHAGAAATRFFDRHFAAPA